MERSRSRYARSMKESGRTYRVFTPQLAQLAVPGALLLVEGPEAHHALRVLRLEVGDKVELFDGAGRKAKARIDQGRRDQMSVVVESVHQVNRAGPTIHLAFAVPKGNRLDWLLEKSTELGATSLQPVRFARSVAGGDELSEAKQQRWLGQCVAAAKQSGLDYLPEICPMITAEELANLAVGWIRLLGDPRPEARTLAEELAGASGREICLAVGPEGGLTDEESQLLVQKGFTPVRLGHSVLRVETAALALLSAVQAILDKP